MIDHIIAAVKYLASNWDVVLGALIALLVGFIALMKAVIGIALLIPGEQPEKFLQSVVDLFQKYVDWLSKFSKKPSA